MVPLASVKVVSSKKLEMLLLLGKSSFEVAATTGFYDPCPVPLSLRHLVAVLTRWTHKG